MEKLFFGQNQCPSLFWIRVTSLNAMGRFFLPNFVLLSFGCFNSIGFVGYLFVTEMMNCFVEPFPRFLHKLVWCGSELSPPTHPHLCCLPWSEVVPKLDQCFPRPFVDITATKKAAEVLSSLSCVVLFVETWKLFLLPVFTDSKLHSAQLHTVYLFQLNFWSLCLEIEVVSKASLCWWFEDQECGRGRLFPFISVVMNHWWCLLKNWSLSARSVFIGSKLDTVFLFHLRSLFRPRSLVFFCFFALINVSAAAQSKPFIWNYSMFSSPFHYLCIKSIKQYR